MSVNWNVDEWTLGYDFIVRKAFAQETNVYTKPAYAKEGLLKDLGVDFNPYINKYMDIGYDRYNACVEAMQDDELANICFKRLKQLGLLTKDNCDKVEFTITIMGIIDNKPYEYGCNSFYPSKQEFEKL